MKKAPALSALLRRCHPLPAALLGYLIGILLALTAESLGTVYVPLSLREALVDAYTAELPFWVAALLLALVRPIRLCGGLLVALRTACCGFAALHLLGSAHYFAYVFISLIMTAIYICLVGQAVDLFTPRSSDSRQTLGEYALRWLFYAGTALLLLPLRYIIGY